MISSNYVNLTTFPTKLGSATKPCPVWDVMIMDDEDNVVSEPDKVGKIIAQVFTGHIGGVAKVLHHRAVAQPRVVPGDERIMQCER